MVRSKRTEQFVKTHGNVVGHFLSWKHLSSEEDRNSENMKERLESLFVRCECDECKPILENPCDRIVDWLFSSEAWDHEFEGRNHEFEGLWD